MSQLENRIRRLEDIHTPGAVRIVIYRPGESAEQAIARYQEEGIRLAPAVIILPEVCETTEEWTKRYAPTPQ